MIQNTEIVKELSLPPVKIHCSVLAEDAIKAAIKDYQSKQNVRTLQRHINVLIPPKVDDDEEDEEPKCRNRIRRETRTRTSILYQLASKKKKK